MKLGERGWILSGLRKGKKKSNLMKLKRSSLSMRWRQRLGVWQGDAEAVQEPGLSRERSDGSRER